jgi:S1-C subfamily serine protease
VSPWSDVNWLDLLLGVLFVIAAMSGFRRGALLQLLAYGGLAAGLMGGALLAAPLAGLARTPGAQAVVAAGVLLGGAALGNAVGWLAGSWARTRAHATSAGVLDRAAGSLVSVVAVLLATWFLALNLVNGPLPALSREIRGSAIVRGLGATLPPPPSLLAEVRTFLNRYGFPEVFLGLPPAPSGPVPEPAPAGVRRAVRAAEASTFRVIGRACGQIQSGTGFAISDHRVVTNAHVVAGVEAPVVQAPNGSAQKASVVLFDPGTDLAVLRVDGVPGPGLTLEPALVGRGVGGATLGYPGGGPLAAEPAAVRRAIDALGRDIYGRNTVQREVYELQARVEPGDSGGPFVTPDGMVAGVVFAASTTDDGIGYAIASTEVLRDLRTARGSAPTSTGPCVR